MLKKLWSRVVEINRKSRGEIHTGLAIGLAWGLIVGLSGYFTEEGLIEGFSVSLVWGFGWSCVLGTFWDLTKTGGLMIGFSGALGGLLGASLALFPLPTLSVLGAMGVSMGILLYLRKSRTR